MKLLTCQRDAYLETLATEVLACTPGAAGWRVVLADTVLYPEGGGQPADRGTVGGVAVRDVLREADGTVVHWLEAALPLGPVEVVVDWARRFDHMQQHTAQHLLTAIAHDQFGYATVAFHLSADRCDIELAVPSVAPAELMALQARANEAVRQARAVRVVEVAAGELAGLQVRTRGLPPGHEGPVRLVEIDGLDRNTCGGTHVRSTAEIQAIQLLGSERAHGVVRLFYLAGGRVLAALQTALERERALTALLTVGAGEQVAAVTRLVAEQRETERARRALAAEWAELVGRALVAAGAGPVVFHRADADLALLGSVAAAIQVADPERLALLTAGEGAAGVFLLVGPAERVAALGPQVASLLEARGGGRGGRFQGKAARLERRAEAAHLLAAAP